jgi:hypothetical protein
MERLTWSKTEKKIARAAYDKAYLAQCQRIVSTLRDRVAALDDPRDVWQIDDFLRQKRKEVDATFDFRYSVLVFVFVQLIADGLITMDDLAGLREDKIEGVQRILDIRRAAQE